MYKNTVYHTIYDKIKETLRKAGKTRMNNNKMQGKSIWVVLDTLIGQAADPDHESGNPCLIAKDHYSGREDMYKFISQYLADRQTSVQTGMHGETLDDAFDQNGNLQVEFEIMIGRNIDSKFYVDVTKEGFYIYEDANLFDERDQTAARFVTNPQDAAALSMATALAANDRFEAQQSWMAEYTKDEQQERDRIKRELKKISNPEREAVIEQNLTEAQKALDAKRANGRKDPAYQKLLIPTEMETIQTLPNTMNATQFEKQFLEKDQSQAADFANAIAALSEQATATTIQI